MIDILVIAGGIVGAAALGYGVGYVLRHVGLPLDEDGP